MSQDIYSQFLRFQVEESAASTLTEGTAILTGASVNRVADKNIALEIHGIQASIPMPQDLPAAGTTEDIAFCLSTRSGLSAFPNIDDEHVIYITQMIVKAGIATYLPLITRNDQYMPPYVEFKHPLLLSHAKIYPYVLSSNSSTKANVRGYLLFTYVLLGADLAIEALESFR